MTQSSTTPISAGPISAGPILAGQAFPHLFSPLKVGSKTLKHRLNFGAHTANMSEGGLPMDRHLGYYSERARGGAAMIVVEPVPPHRTGVFSVPRPVLQA